MSYSRIIAIFLFLLSPGLLVAQDKPLIKASVSKNKILIGEPFQLNIEVHIYTGGAGKFAGIDSIPHFEFLEKPVIDSSNSNGENIIKGIYKLTSFDSGHWVIPSFVVAPGIKSDTIPFDVVFSDFDPQQDYHDIKDIIEVKPKKKQQWWWYAAGGALILAALFIYLARRKKPAPVIKQQPDIDPYQEAIGRLDRLEQERQDPKAFYSSLTDIFRLYVFRRNGILSLQKTTDDLVIQLRGLGLSREQFDRLSQSLRLSDFVKFAKYVPTAADNSSALEDIRQSIMAIEQITTPVKTDGTN